MDENSCTSVGAIECWSYYAVCTHDLHKNDIYRVEKKKQKEKNKDIYSDDVMQCTQLFSFCSLSLRCWCNCSIPSGPLSALQFTQERDVRSNGSQRTNNSKITPRFLSLVFRLKRHCQGEKKAAFFGQGDTSEDRIAPLR